ncbi:MAG: RNA 2',3'-cyclic phosphodiesterase [Bacteriovorax sp.]|jgi:2'-5' RNA ligase
MRLFIGIEIPVAVKNEIYNWLGPLQKSDKGWECSKDYHLTLLFIGESSENECEEIKRRINMVSLKAFELETDDLKFFNRRILYLDLKPSPDLLELHSQILKLFPSLIRPDEKEFIPHVTVKRWQRYEYDELLNGIETLAFKTMRFPASSVALFKSEIDSEGQKYHVIYKKLLN